MVFSYSDSVYPIRADFGEAHRAYWHELARPGCWWNGAERVAIAAAVRSARDCGLCAERKQALTPNAVQGEHAHAGVLPTVAVEAVHRITSDPSRLSKAWVDGLAKQGLSDAAYVETVGIVVAVVSIDSFHRNLGLPLEPLPKPEGGEPSGYRPPSAEPGEAWVPWIRPEKASGSETDLYFGMARVPHVGMAMSLVPDAVRAMGRLSEAQYIALAIVAMPGRNQPGRALERAQIELVAGRVSALNECFY
ncbi:MAG: alkylhydroperoxidase-related (seleno)protein [Myxococcota bacterium]|jgi:hypothetical protein